MAETAESGADGVTATTTTPSGAKTALTLSEVNYQMLMQQKDELLNNLDMDPYDEDQAELRFLYSKPTCFIVVGKPGSGKTTLAQRLAQEWKCQLVNATETIQQAIDMQTEMGLKAQEILMRGEAIPESMAAKFIEDKINSPEVAHHGYVLDDFPSLSEEFLSVKDQVELIKNWKLKPDFIINIKVPDKDLEARRIGQRIDPHTGVIYTQEIYDPDKPASSAGDEGEGEEEEEEEEEMEEEQDVQGLTELPPEVIERMIKRPEDLPNFVSENIRTYKSNILRILEDYMADHDRQYLIELDGNKNSALLHKELMSRLACFVLRPAAIPIRLQDGEEEELPEEIDTDELLRSLAPKQMVAPRYRWRRSRWMRNCPVALAEGNLMQGKPEFAVSFLDKIYILSSEEAMGKFMKNPRPYLLPPQPRPPIKMVVTGPPLSGKSSLCHLLAQKYNAKVLDMDDLVKPKLEEEKAKMLQQVKDEAVENAITTVRQRIKEQIEAEAAQKEETTEEEKVEDKEAEDSEEVGEKPEDGEADNSDEATTAVTEDTKPTESAPQEDESPPEDQEDKAPAPSETTATDGEKSTDFTIDVDAFHPDVVAMVELALDAAKENEVTLAAETYIDIMEEAIRESEKSMRARDANGPLNGGWIFDNFPRTRDQWNVMLERGISVDDIVALKDESDNGEFLMKRWYYLNRREIDQKILERKAFEMEEKRKAEEAERLKKEEEKRLEEEAARKAREEERQRRIDAGEEVSDEDAEGAKPVEPVTEDEKPVEETEEPPIVVVTPEIEIKIEDTSVGEIAPEKSDLPAQQNKDLLQATDDSSVVPSTSADGTEIEAPSNAPGDPSSSPPPATPEEEKMPPDGPELEARKDVRKHWEGEWTASLAVISGASSVEPILVDVCARPEDSTKFVKRGIDDQMSEVVGQMEKQLMYSGWEMQGMDLDEEEEDAGGDEEEEEEEEAAPEEEEDPNRSLKKNLGDVNYFCPVALKENFVLWPGNPEVAAKYREKTYYFSSPENREKFLAEPTVFLPKNKPFEAPPIRLLILGPKGAGKSLHGRNLARQLGLFHIQFRERLQEMVIAKTKKKIGPEYEEEGEEEPEPEIEDSDDEDEGAITGPDGEKVEKEEKKPEEPKPEEEEEEINFTEEEEAIANYLKEDEPLPIELLEKIIGPWWEQEPFKNTGFVLEGFPRTADEASYLAERGLFPDSAIILVVEDSDILGRLLPPKLDKWRKKRDKKNERKRLIKEKKDRKRKAAMDKRRAELEKELEEKRAERRAEKGNESDAEGEEEEEEEDEEDDIEATLAAEFEEEEEEEEEDEETEEDATDRMRNELEEVYDNDTNRLAAVQEKLEEILIPRIDLDGGRKPHIVRYQLGKRTRNIIQFRHSLFERVYPVKEILALKMLRTGYKQPSRFGRWCPVQLKDGDCVQPMQGPGYPTYPAIYRNYLYFMATSQNREAFMKDPMTYLKQSSPKPVVPIRLSIIGPPKSGKTTLSKRFADEFGLIRLSIGEAVRTVIENQPKSALVRTMNAYLFRGRTIPDELLVQCLDVALSNMQCQTRGYVLDGFPVSKNQVDLMTQRSIIPVRVIDLRVPSRELVTRATVDRYAADKPYTQHDSAQILAIKLAAFQKEIEPIRQWYKDEHSNLVPVEGQHSKWWVWHQALETAKASVMQIQTYLQRISEGKAASIADMCITPQEFVVRLGDYDQYCPVALADRGELVDCTTTRSLEHAVEFRGHYYKTCSKAERDSFLNEPEKYVPPLAPRKLPPKELLPKRLTGDEAKAMFPKSFEIQGYCPVTFLDGKLRYEAIVPGDPEMVVLYRDKLYSMQDEERLQKFMRLPEDYWDLKLPHKLPPKKKDLPLMSLPMLGYMEQTVAVLLTKALTAVGNFKPKYPFLTPTRSSLVYVAYFLKANNPRNSDYIRKKYNRKLSDYENTCKLINYLGDNMSRKYKDPKDRPQEFDFKLEMFIQLKDKEPTATWVA